MCLSAGPALAIDFKRLPCSTEVCMQVLPKMDIVAVLTVQLSGLFLSLTRVTLKSYGYVQKKQMCSTTTSSLMIYVCHASPWSSISWISESSLCFHFQVSPKQQLNEIFTVWLQWPQKCLSVNSSSDYLYILIIIGIGFSCSIFFCSCSATRMSEMQDQMHVWLDDLTNVTATIYLLQGRRSEMHTAKSVKYPERRKAWFSAPVLGILISAMKAAYILYLLD